MFGKKMILTALLMMSVLLMTAATGCGQTIYEDPEYVDFSAEEDETTEPEVIIVEEKDEIQQPCFEQDGICLYYDPQLVLDVQPLSEKIIAEEEGPPYVVAHPNIIHFDLSMEQAQVYIVDVEAYETVADFAAESFSQLDALISDPDSLSDCVPELPLDTFYRTCDHQQFAANLKAVNFANGSGIRFITVHGIQDFAPVDNENLVYVFQGFTDDGNYFIKMYVNLLHSQLPDTGEIPQEVYTGDQEVVSGFFESIADSLNSSEDDYSPTLDWIDDFLASLRIEQAN